MWEKLLQKCLEKVAVPTWMLQIALRKCGTKLVVESCVAKIVVPDWTLQTFVEKVVAPNVLQK